MSKLVTILTVGSQGDVQPFLSLALGLQEAGYRVRIAANPEFREFVTERGVGFAELGPDPNKAFPKLASEEAKEFRKVYADVYADWMKQWMLGGLDACNDADIICVGPVAEVGFDVAEKLGKPCIKLGYSPTTPTKAFPNPELPWNFSAGSLVNWLSHIGIDQISWWLSRSIHNELRRNILSLEPLGFRSPQQLIHSERLPVLYGYSPSVVSRPADWPEWVHVTGYWYLDPLQSWTPPPCLQAFLAAGPSPVYFELGSLTVLVQETVRNVLRGFGSAKCRVVVDPRGADLNGVQLTEDVYVVRDSVPHSWILPRVGAAVTHGGPGTVAAVVRAGIPVKILPIFRGHSFWGHRLQELGVGLPPTPARGVRPEQIARSASMLLGDADMRCRAADLGRQIRAEDGVGRAVEVCTHLFPPSPTIA